LWLRCYSLVHLDLVPCNITWLLINNTIEIKLFDFDSASDINSPIPQLLLDKRAGNNTLYFDYYCYEALPQLDAWFCYLYESVEPVYLTQKKLTTPMPRMMYYPFSQNILPPRDIRSSEMVFNFGGRRNGIHKMR
jgi:hypothetical protein